jgi:protein SCO1/2
MSRRLFLSLAIFLLGLAGLIVAMFMIVAGQQGAQAVAIGGQFHLTSMDDRQVTDADFKGHPFLVFFGYTHCPDICPTELFQISQVLKARGNDRQIKALFITVDPERDTPAVMKKYLSSFDPRIIGLSGTREETDAVEKEYRVYARKAPTQDGNYAMDHTAVIYLMDKQGRFASAFNVDRPPQVAAKDLNSYL